MSWRDHPTMKRKSSGLKPGQRVRFAFRRDKNEAPIVYALRLHGWTVVELNGTPGLPDLLCVKGGRTVLLEVKGEKGSLTPAQVRMHRSLEHAGAELHIVRSPQEALQVVAA